MFLEMVVALFGGHIEARKGVVRGWGTNLKVSRDVFSTWKCQEACIVFMRFGAMAMKYHELLCNPATGRPSTTMKTCSTNISLGCFPSAACPPFCVVGCYLLLAIWAMFTGNFTI